MPFCSQCGASVEGKFCSRCGTPTPAGPPAGASPASSDLNFILDENIACAACYLMFVLTGVLFLVLPPYNQNRKIRFHAYQSIFFWMACVVSGFALAMVSLVLSRIPLLGFLIIGLTGFVLGLSIFFLWLMLMYRAYQNELFVLPVLGPFARRQV